MSMAVRPIHIPGKAALDWLRQQSLAALDDWGREWLSAWTPGDVRMQSLTISGIGDRVRPPLREYEAVSGGSGSLWVRRSAADLSSFGRIVLGAELMPRLSCVDDWVAETADHAWNARNRALCASLLGAATTQLGASSELPADLFAFGSGAVVISCDALGLHAIADKNIWSSVPPGTRAAGRSPPMLTPVEQATRNKALRLDVMLGSVEVELPKLLDLRTGDVVRLPQRLDEGITVLCEGQPLAQATLGATQGYKGVQLFTHNRTTQ